MFLKEGCANIIQFINETNLISMVEERIKAWQGLNPEKQLTSILFYRDGVSESQFDVCKSSEIESVKEAYRNIYGKDSEVNLTFVIAGKRHHTRFYARTEKDTYKMKNPVGAVPAMVDNGNLKAGLLVENVVTAPGETNFYLQSHIALKGTARSAHYTVLIDAMNLDDRLPKLTLMLCYAFQRATTGVSYASPAYIADRLCERGRVYLREWANNEGAAPSWKQPKDKNEKPLTEQNLLDWKEARAEDLAKDPRGPWYTPRPNRPDWLNPWHPDLENTMFWM